MCLIIETSKPEFKVAENDIVCYKILNHSNPFRYMTAFMGFKIPFLSMCGLKKFKAKGEPNVKTTYGRIRIEGGVIHTFQMLHDALDNKYRSLEEVWECIIPKGSRYVEGKYILRGTFTSYGSECIKFVKRVD